VKNALREYRGIWRRFQIIKNGQVAVVSDYAHHPSAVTNTIEAAREFFTGRRIVAIFQPHQHDRTKKLFKDFVESFKFADVVVVPEIYDVKGREEEFPGVTSKDLATAIAEKFPDKVVRHAEDLAGAKEMVNSLLQPEDVVLVMGAGDVYEIAKEIEKV
jgi:UDP-N-acetylmuramate--alanine ligase